MAITGRFDLRPYGYAAKPLPIVQFSIHTTEDFQYHSYTVTYGKTVKRGYIKKTRSGHKNLFHLLSAIFADMKIDGFSEDYLPCPLEQAAEERKAKIEAAAARKRERRKQRVVSSKVE